MEKVNLSVVLDDDLDTLVRKRASEMRLSISDIVRLALMAYFKEEI
ncbi:MAG: ribbon-helix-helix protein, CopG family [Candidatus Hodarchaeales archaeon]